LTDKKWLGIDPNLLTVTVYKDDDEAADIWHEQIGLPTSRISREEEDENFWPASAPSEGPDGVCGPCSEIYYHPPGGKEVEIWNLVFTQFNRVGDPPDNLRPLPSKNIDTGMGLERTAATLQGVPTNYHIDNLLPIVEAAAEVVGVKYDYASDNGRRLRRITDHIRACTFAVHENVYPGANKEKYVIKRLLRRAVLDGHQMGLREPFLYQLVGSVAEQMKVPYPELGQTVDRVADVIKSEEANFFATIDGGLNRIERVFDDMKTANKVTVEGAAAADLYQTYGVPPELFEALAAEHNLAFDWPGYKAAMQQHGEASGKLAHSVMDSKGPIDSLKRAFHQSEFVGYDTTECQAKVLGVIAGTPPHDQLCDQMDEIGHDTPVRLVLDRTPFYGESGGQVGDTGTIAGDGFTFEVTDTQKDGGLVVHYGHLRQGTIREGDDVTATVDVPRRDAIRRAHSATHMLHYALQKNVGSHAQQQGSKVDADWLRFDFSNVEPVAKEKLAAITADVLDRVAASDNVKWETVPLAEARAQGAMMLFGEKYPDPVRMVSMGSFSKELCGGTHLTSTSQVEAFEILSEEGVSAGVRRIVALTGTRAAEHRQQMIDTICKLADHLRTTPLDTPGAVRALLERRKDLKRALDTGTAASTTDTPGSRPNDWGRPEELEYAAVKAAITEIAQLLSVAPAGIADRIEAMQTEITTLAAQLAARDAAGPVTADSLIERGEQIGSTLVVVADTPGVAPNLMRQLIDTVRQKAKTAAVLLAASDGDDKVTLIAGITADLQDRGVSAGKWIGPVAQVLGGGGGGRPDMAQAGGKHPEKLPEALQVARDTIAAMLG
jgi:alanyl-tRNA synthetase